MKRRDGLARREAALKKDRWKEQRRAELGG